MTIIQCTASSAAKLIPPTKEHALIILIHKWSGARLILAATAIEHQISIEEKNLFLRNISIFSLKPAPRPAEGSQHVLKHGSIQKWKA